MIHTVCLNPAIDRTLRCVPFKPREVNTAEVLGYLPAGKAVNVSRILAQLEVPSTLLGFIGRAEAAWFRAFLEGPHLTFQLTPVAGTTRTNTTIVEEPGIPETHIREQGFTVTPAEVAAFTAAAVEAVRPGDMVCVSGSLPPGYTAEHLARFITACHSRRAETFVDADGRILRTLAAMPPLLIKPNLEELAALTGKTGPVDAMLDTALALGFRGILLSRGADSLVHADMAGRRVQKSPAVTAVNTVGAGDACLAGYLAARYEGLELPDRLAWAAAAGAASARERFAGVLDTAWFERELRKLPRGS